MLDYRLAPVNLAPAWRPGLGSPVASSLPRKMGDGEPRPGAILGAGALTLGLGTALSAGTAWVGFSTGSREEGFLSVLGYIVGSIGALTAVGGMASLLLLGIAGISGNLPAMPSAAPAVPQKTSPWVSTEQA
jgi:hypothetical protein